MANLIQTILEHEDPVVRKEALATLIQEGRATEVLVLTGVSVLSDDPEVRRLALTRLDERGDASRAILLIRSWRDEGSLLAMAEAMNAEQQTRAAEIEAAFYLRHPLASAIPNGNQTVTMASLNRERARGKQPALEPPVIRDVDPPGTTIAPAAASQDGVEPRVADLRILTFKGYRPVPEVLRELAEVMAAISNRPQYISIPPHRDLKQLISIPLSLAGVANNLSAAAEALESGFGMDGRPITRHEVAAGLRKMRNEVWKNSKFTSYLSVHLEPGDFNFIANTFGCLKEVAWIIKGKHWGEAGLVAGAVVLVLLCLLFARWWEGVLVGLVFGIFSFVIWKKRKPGRATDPHPRPM